MDRRTVTLLARLTLPGFVLVLSLMIFIYPAWTLMRVLGDEQLRTTGQTKLIPSWFEQASKRYASWAEGFLESDYAAQRDHQNVAATEWPMFGSAFFLVTAEDLHHSGKIDAREGVFVEAVEKAAAIVASPVTATWVIDYWGDDYLHRENVFYRMLLMLGLSSYESITGDESYRDLISEQRAALTSELTAAPYNLLDDYPGSCYPTDVLWAVAAIQRVARLDGHEHDALVTGLMAHLDGAILAREGLPAFQVLSRSGKHLQGARGCSNSGVLLFAYELDPLIAARWYTAYEKGFWKQSRWLCGFTESPHGSAQNVMDVDSGPVLFGYGSVASAFGIGAAKTAGRLDHAVPLTLEAVACSWPTPFGFLLPGFMGRLAADSWSLGEVALLFSMTRPTKAASVLPFSGDVPRVVYSMLWFYLIAGSIFISFEVRSIIKTLGAFKQRNDPA